MKEEMVRGGRGGGKVIVSNYITSLLWTEIWFEARKKHKRSKGLKEYAPSMTVMRESHLGKDLYVCMRKWGEKVREATEEAEESTI